MEQTGSLRADPVAQVERPLGMFGMLRDVASHHLERERSRHRQDRAVITSGNRMRVTVGLTGIKKENVVGVGEQGLPAPSSPEKAAPDEDDAMCLVRFLRPLALIVSLTPEVGNRD